MKIIITILFAGFLFGCTQKGGDFSASTGDAVAASAVVNQEISEVTAALNSTDNYKLTAEEIKLLEDEKLLEEGDLEELEKLTH